jgi:hypothetical protein
MSGCILRISSSLQRKLYHAIPFVKIGLLAGFSPTPSGNNFSLDLF